MYRAFIKIILIINILWLRLKIVLFHFFEH